ncbi:hypothetical protein H5410_039806 [Solanum commersonii]|uniref:FBD domain-containing protein n=1 Tax=Solanum commersonii TaxID=4109 RepID=A0A9J5XPK4_SOLCO|nr:hypothetical protein H5410_039806 [Solanum commersonii]
MAKKSKKREDRLSDLPDSILIHILSMLCEDTEDSKKVVRTSVLSKRWQFLWMSVPVSLEIEFPDHIFGPPDPLQRTECTCLKELFHNVVHVEKLELGPRCIQYLSILELEGWQPPLSSWKFLQLGTDLEQLNFPGICCFLQNSSDLKTLVIDGDKYQSTELLLKYTNKDEQIMRFETRDFNCSFLHLKTLKILKFSGCVMPLVKYLLKHAIVLEKFITAAKYKRNDLYYVKMVQEVLSIPRSSPQASVIFSYR